MLNTGRKEEFSESKEEIWIRLCIQIINDEKDGDDDDRDEKGDYDHEDDDLDNPSSKSLPSNMSAGRGFPQPGHCCRCDDHDDQDDHDDYDDHDKHDDHDGHDDHDVDIDCDGDVGDGDRDQINFTKEKLQWW